jgi:hypothetical protein
VTADLQDQFANTNILIVDDMQDNIDVLARRLRNRQATVYEASDATEALDILSVSPIDILLLDVMMPGLIPACVVGDSGGGFPKSWKCESMASLIWRAWPWDQRLVCGMILTERH